MSIFLLPGKRHPLRTEVYEAKKGVLSRTKVRAELPLRLSYDALLAFRFFADIHPALGSGGGFQLLQGQLDGGVTVARCHHRADSCTAGAFQATACAACSSSLLDSPHLSFNKSDLFDIVIKSL